MIETRILTWLAIAVLVIVVYRLLNRPSRVIEKEWITCDGDCDCDCVTDRQIAIGELAIEQVALVEENEDLNAELKQARGEIERLKGTV